MVLWQHLPERGCWFQWSCADQRSWESDLETDGSPFHIYHNTWTTAKSTICTVILIIFPPLANNINQAKSTVSPRGKSIFKKKKRNWLLHVHLERHFLSLSLCKNLFSHECGSIHKNKPLYSLSPQNKSSRGRYAKRKKYSVSIQ